MATIKGSEKRYLLPSEIKCVHCSIDLLLKNNERNLKKLVKCPKCSVTITIFDLICKGYISKDDISVEGVANGLIDFYETDLNNIILNDVKTRYKNDLKGSPYGLTKLIYNTIYILNRMISGYLDATQLKNKFDINKTQKDYSDDYDRERNIHFQSNNVPRNPWETETLQERLQLKIVKKNKGSTTFSFVPTSYLEDYYPFESYDGVSDDFVFDYMHEATIEELINFILTDNDWYIDMVIVLNRLRATGTFLNAINSI